MSYQVKMNNFQLSGNEMADIPFSTSQVIPMTGITRDNPFGPRGESLDGEEYSLEHPKTRLCSLCQNISDHWTDVLKLATGKFAQNGDSTLNFQHHHSKAALTESASSGCGLCIQFARSLSTEMWDEKNGSAVEVYAYLGRNWRLRLHSNGTGKKRHQTRYSTVQMLPSPSPGKIFFTAS